MGPIVEKGLPAAGGLSSLRRLRLLGDAELSRAEDMQLVAEHLFTCKRVKMELLKNTGLWRGFAIQ